jgi:hypothetical protein
MSSQSVNEMLQVGSSVLDEIDAEAVSLNVLYTTTDER